MTRCRHRHLNVQRRYVGQVDFISLLRQPTRRSEEHTSELQSQSNLVCRLLLEKKKKKEPQSLKVRDPRARPKDATLLRELRLEAVLMLPVIGRGQRYHIGDIQGTQCRWCAFTD